MNWTACCRPSPLHRSNSANSIRWHLLLAYVGVFAMLPLLFPTALLAENGEGIPLSVEYVGPPASSPQEVKETAAQPFAAKPVPLLSPGLVQQAASMDPQELVRVIILR